MSYAVTKMQSLLFGRASSGGEPVIHFDGDCPHFVTRPDKCGRTCIHYHNGNCPYKRKCTVLEQKGKEKPFEEVL